MTTQAPSKEKVETIRRWAKSGETPGRRELFTWAADEVERLNHNFKNSHRLLCERFGYVHDEKDWERDQLSLIEHIAARYSSHEPGALHQIAAIASDTSYAAEDRIEKIQQLLSGVNPDRPSIQRELRELEVMRQAVGYEARMTLDAERFEHYYKHSNILTHPSFFDSIDKWRQSIDENIDMCSCPSPTKGEGQ